MLWRDTDGSWLWWWSHISTHVLKFTKPHTKRKKLSVLYNNKKQINKINVKHRDQHIREAIALEGMVTAYTHYHTAWGTLGRRETKLPLELLTLHPPKWGAHFAPLRDSCCLFKLLPLYEVPVQRTSIEHLLYLTSLTPPYNGGHYPIFYWWWNKDMDSLSNTTGLW